MKTSKILSVSILSLFLIGCIGNNAKKNAQVKTEVHSNVKNAPSILLNVEDTTSISLDVNKMRSKTFVLSCGSGCAMRFTAVKITQKGNSLIVKFEVEMFIDTKLDNTNYVNYTFIYKENELQKVEYEGENDNVLEKLSPDAQTSFRTFANDLISIN